MAIDYRHTRRELNLVFEVASWPRSAGCVLRANSNKMRQNGSAALFSVGDRHSAIKTSIPSRHYQEVPFLKKNQVFY